MLFKSGAAGGNFETKLRIKPADEWTSTSGGNISINDMDMAEGTPSNPTSDASSGDYVYEEVSETLTATTYTIPGGTFDLGSIRTPYYLELGTPSTTSGGSVDYPNF